MILWRRGLLRKAGIVLLYILYIPAVHAAIIAHARHSVLIVPFLAIPAAICLVSAWRALLRNAEFRPEPFRKCRRCQSSGLSQSSRYMFIRRR